MFSSLSCELNDRSRLTVNSTDVNDSNGFITIDFFGYAEPFFLGGTIARELGQSKTIVACGVSRGGVSRVSTVAGPSNGDRSTKGEERAGPIVPQSTEVMK